MQKMVVTASNGRSVAIRKGDSTEAMVVRWLPVGTVVDAFDDIGGWREVMYDGTDGWMMSKFLVPADGKPDTPDAPGKVLTPAQFAQLRDLQNQVSMIGEAMRIILST